MIKKIHITLIFLLTLACIGCSAGGSTPYIPPDPPTADELADLIGEWEGLTETDTGLLDLLHLNFFEHAQYIQVTVYLNNNFVDEPFVEYDGDRVRFNASNLWGDYAEFDGTIDHENLIYSGSFYVQMGISQRSGTFELYKQ